MKIKCGDNALVIAGKDKGKTGKVVKVLKKQEKVILEKINMVKKHAKPNQNNETGGIFDIEAPIHMSNVKVIENIKKPTKEKKTKPKTKE